MDQKDTQATQGYSNGQSMIQQSANDFYKKHSLVSVIIKKTEKITTAIYMVTDFLPESEPLRSHLRTLALSLTSEARKIGSRSDAPNLVLADDIARTIDESCSLITLASTIGLVSEMNSRILITEMEKVKGEINRHYGEKKPSITTHPGYANILLSQSMFDVELPKTDSMPVIEKMPEVSKGQIENENVRYEKEVEPETKQEPVAKKTDIGIKIGRRHDILSIIKSKGKVSIKDIASFLKDISEKTIQRELLALVQDGVLVKEGEKRWSTYRIAS